MSDVKLYNYWRSSASYRVRIALFHKGIPFEYVPVNLAGGAQLEDAYAAVNPARAVPTLLIDGETISESMAIMEYLDEARPGPALLPKGAAARAQVRRLAEQVNSGVQPYQNLHLLKKLRTDFGANDAQVQAWAGHYNRVGLEKLEALLARTAGRCSFGDEVSIADLCLIPQTYSARRFGVDPAAFPTVARVEQHLLSLPAFQKAHPDAQPDAPKA